MRISIKFSTINFIILSELYYIVKPKRTDFKAIILFVKKYMNCYYKYGPKYKYFSDRFNPDIVEISLQYKEQHLRIKGTVFNYLFSWGDTENGYYYWQSIYELITNYYNNLHERENC